MTENKIYDENSLDSFFKDFPEFPKKYLSYEPPFEVVYNSEYTIYVGYGVKSHRIITVQRLR